MATIKHKVVEHFDMECEYCGKVYDVPMTARDLEGYERRFLNGERILIQEALPDVPRELREMFLSGTCPECWEMFYGIAEEG